MCDRSVVQKTTLVRPCGCKFWLFGVEPCRVHRRPVIVRGWALSYPEKQGVELLPRVRPLPKKRHRG